MPKLSRANRVLSACSILGLVGAIVVFDLGCPGTDESNSSATVAVISVTPNPTSVRIGGTISVHASVTSNTGEALDDRPITWSTGNAAIATVAENGQDAYVTGVAVGSTTITAATGGKIGTTQVTVTVVPVATVTVSGPATIQQGTSITFTAVLKDAAGTVLTGRQVDWSSSSPSVASVSQTGTVTGNALGGPVTITATSEFQSGAASTTVVGAPVATVSVAGPATITLGQTGTFSLVLRDAAGNILNGRVLTWSSSNSAIASVDQNGTVTGVALGGPVTISVTCEGKTGGAPVTVTAPTALTGRVINYVNGNPISGAIVNFRRNDGGIGSLWGSVTSAADGSFTSPTTSTDVSQGVIIEALATGFVTGRVLIAAVTFGGTTPAGDVPLVPISAQPGGISGTIRNAITNAAVAGATVAAFDNIQTNAIQTTTSDGSGNFALSNLPAGTYRVSASATGFTTSQRTGVAVGNGGTTANQDLVLSPTGTNAVIIVLTWGASPSDLDSHLTGPNADASRFHVYYASRGSTTAAPFANLDVDDVSSFGPETIRILQMNSGVYRYSVHDFSNRGSSSSSALGASGAKVQVYTATGAQTFFVPGSAGTLWTVFELSGTLAAPIIQPKNVMSFTSDASTITSPPMGSGGFITDAGLIAWGTAQHPKPKP